VTKLGWLEVEQYKQTVVIVHQMMQSAETLVPVALRFFEELIREIVEPLKNRTMLLHRKTAFDFKNNSLRYMLEIAGGLLDTSYTVRALDICSRVLGFDFLAITLDETSEDPTSVQFPSDWENDIVSLPPMIAKATP
jgi:hypothetical protein